MYVEFILEHDYYLQLMFYTRSLDFPDYMAGVYAWACFVIGHIVAILVAWIAAAIIMTY